MFLFSFKREAAVEDQSIEFLKFKLEYLQEHQGKCNFTELCIIYLHTTRSFLATLLQYALLQ